MKKQISLSLAAAVVSLAVGCGYSVPLPDIGPFFVQPGRSGRHHRSWLLREPQRVHDSQGAGRRQARA